VSRRCRGSQRCYRGCGAVDHWIDYGFVARQICCETGDGLPATTLRPQEGASERHLRSYDVALEWRPTTRHSKEGEDFKKGFSHSRHFKIVQKELASGDSQRVQWGQSAVVPRKKLLRFE
jgi:hypothetical protein